MMLKRQPPKPLARAVGIAVVAVVGLGAGYTAWAAKPVRQIESVNTAAAGSSSKRATADFVMNVNLQIGNEPSRNMKLMGRYGQEMSLENSGNGETLKFEATVAPLANAHYDVQTVIRRDGSKIASPRLTVKAGEPAAITLDASAGATPLNLQLRIGTEAELREMNQQMLKAQADASRATQQAAQAAGEAASAAARAAVAETELPGVQVIAAQDARRNAELQRELARSLAEAQRDIADRDILSAQDRARIRREASDAAKEAVRQAVETAAAARDAGHGQYEAEAARAEADRASAEVQRNAAVIAKRAQEDAKRAVEAARKAAEVARVSARQAASPSEQSDYQWTVLDTRKLKSVNGKPIEFSCDKLVSTREDKILLCGNAPNKTPARR